MRVILITGLLVSLILSSGCSKNENDPLGPDDNNAVTLKLTVNSAEEYYISLPEAKAVTITDHLLENAWDLHIDNLTNINVNGGSTAPGEVCAMLITGTSYTDFKTAPDGIYNTDTQNGGVIGDEWWDYNPATHIVTPKDQFYVIKAASGDYYKFQISESMFSSRTDGELSFKFEKLTAPAAPEMQDVSGRVRMAVFNLSVAEKSYFQFKKGDAVSVTDPANSQDWDIGSEYVTLNMNGGTSGSGLAGAIAYAATEFDSIKSAPADGYMSDDTTGGTSAIGDDWYDYNPVTHSLTVKDQSWVIRTALGKYAKLQFVKTEFASQNGGVVVIRFEYLEDGNIF